jgi:hypothetical protein
MLNCEHVRRRLLCGSCSLGFAAILLAVCAWPQFSSAADGPTWKAGLSKAVITPDTSVWLAGYGGTRAPEGKLHDLYMKALALEDADGRRAVLITSDFQGVPKVMSDPVFEEVREQFHLERDQINWYFRPRS